MAPPSESFESKVHDIYPGIDPSRFVGSNKGRVVFITGVSKGLGLASAKAFAQSGASLFLSARSASVLQKIHEELETTYQVPVASAVIDVSDEKTIIAGVEACVKAFGRIDVVISNAGGGEGGAAVGESVAGLWIKTINLNIGGSFMVARYTIPELEKTKGHIVFMGSVLGQLRIPNGSSYNLSKSAMNRLAEWVQIDHGDKGVKAYSIHPGAVLTDLSAGLLKQKPHMRAMFVDTPELSAWSQVRLTSGSDDWLSGRYFDCTWGFDAVEAVKDKIIDEDALKNRLAMPSL